MALSERSDVELLGSGASGDYGLFYDRHLGVVCAYVASRVGQPEVMFDVVAETFARALEKRAQFDPARGPAVGWLLGIARNLIVDSARRGQVEAVSRIRLRMSAVELDDEQLARIVEHGRDDLRVASGRSPPISATRSSAESCWMSPTPRSRSGCVALSRSCASGSRAAWRRCERTWRRGNERSVRHSAR